MIFVNQKIKSGWKLYLLLSGKWYRPGMENVRIGAALCALAALLFAPPAAAQQKVTISAKDCKRLVRLAPSADTAYKPGLDVRGKSVAPADVGGGARLKLPTEITFDMTKDLSKFGGPAEASVGKVKYDILTGKLTFNGQPVATGAAAELAEKCRRAMEGADKP